MSPTLTLRHYLEAPIAHSHDHAQLVFGLSGHLDLEVDGRGSQVRESSVMVLPFSAHHACGSRDGSRCLVLDVPTEYWVLQSLGTHADASRRL
ncbi:AraC family transcriptional regulator, partial [Pseudomonas sp. MAFF 311095]|nr:AraC family transcriptional regulator [Pseudomonas petroselini]